MSGTLDASPAPGVDAGLDDVAEAWRLVRELMIASRPHYLAVLQDVGLSPVQGLALLHLNAEEPLTMSELAAALKCDNSNVTGIVDGLEEKGLATRQPSPDDRRVKLIALTPEGRKLRARLQRAVEKPPAWVERLSEQDRRVLRDVLQRAVE